MKKLLVLLVICFVTFNVVAQIGIPKKKKKGTHSKTATHTTKNKNTTTLIRNLQIDLIPQVRSSLCWVSAMKMVLDYLEPRNKIEMLTILSKIQMNPGVFVNTDSVKCDTSKFYRGEDWNLQIGAGVAGEDSISFYNNQEFDRIFSSLGYYSFEDQTKLSWKEIKKQIDNHRPLILEIQEGESEDLRYATPSHIVVVKGYVEEDKIKHIIINDPWGACRGQRYSLDYNLLLKNNSHIRLLKTIHSIHKKTDIMYSLSASSVVSSPNDPISREESYLNSFYRVNETNTQFLARIDSIIHGISNRKSIVKDVHYISTSKMKNLNENGKIEDTFQDFACKDIILEKENLVVRIQSIEGKWEIVKFLSNFYSDIKNEAALNGLKDYIIFPKIYQAFFRFNPNIPIMIGSNHEIHLNILESITPQYSTSNELNPNVNLLTFRLLKKIKLASEIQNLSINAPQIDHDFRVLNQTLDRLKGRVNVRDINVLLPKIEQLKKEN